MWTADIYCSEISLYLSIWWEITHSRRTGAVASSPRAFISNCLLSDTKPIYICFYVPWSMTWWRRLLEYRSNEFNAAHLFCLLTVSKKIKWMFVQLFKLDFRCFFHFCFILFLFLVIMNLFFWLHTHCLAHISSHATMQIFSLNHSH